MTSGYDCWTRKGLGRRRKIENVGAETMSNQKSSMSALQAWERGTQGGTCPPSGNVLKCFLYCKCFLKYQQTKYLCIILRKCRQMHRPQTRTGALPVDPDGGLPSFRSPHCPSLWAPMKSRSQKRCRGEVLMDNSPSKTI